MPRSHDSFFSDVASAMEFLQERGFRAEKTMGVLFRPFQTILSRLVFGKQAREKGIGRGTGETTPTVDWEGVDLKELNETRWEGIVGEELKSRKLGEADIRSSPKGAVWKVEIARRLRKETTAKNPWIAARLKMGHPNYVSNLVHRSNL